MVACWYHQQATITYFLFIFQTAYMHMKTNKTIKAIAGTTLAAALLVACTKDIKTGVLSTGNFTDTSAALKSVVSYPVGVAVSNAMNSDPAYASIVKRDFNWVTFENDMKHSSIVQSNGTFNFTNADNLMNAVTGMDVYGHVLGWHSQQNAGYLKSFAGITIPAAVELATNPGFESGLTGWSVFNTGNPAGTSTITATNIASEVRTGTSAMKVVNPIGYAGSQWRVQVSSAAFPTEVGKQYTISYWVRATAAGGSIRLSTGPSSPQYQGDQNIGTAWQQVSWTITAQLSSTTFLFDLGQAANTYLIDDVSVKEVVVAPSGAQVANKLDEALNSWITAIVTRYKGKVKAWDVINELFTENGEIRNNANTDITPSHVLVWSNYMGRDYALKAFNYARAADPAAELYINDFNLEISSRKLDSLIAFVGELKAKGAKVDGIGTQMHIAWNTNKAGIESMFQKLGATGLKIRITELDIRTMLNSAATAPTPQLMAYQADMARFVVETYYKYVPPAQRGGITLWGVIDRLSWLYNNGREFPLFYDNNYQRKPSYAGLLQGMRSN